MKDDLVKSCLILSINPLFVNNKVIHFVLGIPITWLWAGYMSEQAYSICDMLVPSACIVYKLPTSGTLSLSIYGSLVIQHCHVAVVYMRACINHVQAHILSSPNQVLFRPVNSTCVSFGEECRVVFPRFADLSPISAIVFKNLIIDFVYFEIDSCKEHPGVYWPKIDLKPIIESKTPVMIDSVFWDWFRTLAEDLHMIGQLIKAIHNTISLHWNLLDLIRW